MADAGGIAKLISDLTARNWFFKSGVGGDTVDGVKTISSTWTRTGATTNTIEWAGTDPSFTASGSVSPANLLVGTGEFSDGILDDDMVCNIGHTAVPLTSGDSIVYTLVRISFTT